MERYFGIFNDNDDILREFCAPPDALDGARVILADYDCGNYEGSALVIFERKGRLYEAHGAHCSCFGLEDQWEPEETSMKALRHRKEHGNYWLSSEVQSTLDAFLSTAPAGEA